MQSYEENGALEFPDSGTGLRNFPSSHAPKKVGL